MTLETILNLINVGVAPLIKVFLLLIILLYGVFAAVVVRQVQLMNKVVNEVNFSTPLFSISLVHLGIAVALFIVTLIIL